MACTKKIIQTTWFSGWAALGALGIALSKQTWAKTLSGVVMSINIPIAAYYGYSTTQCFQGKETQEKMKKFLKEQKKK